MGAKIQRQGWPWKGKMYPLPHRHASNSSPPTQLSDLQNPGEGTGLAIWCGIEVSNKFKQECLLGKRWDQRKCTSKMTPRLYVGAKSKITSTFSSPCSWLQPSQYWWLREAPPMFWMEHHLGLYLQRVKVKGTELNMSRFLAESYLQGFLSFFSFLACYF